MLLPDSENPVKNSLLEVARFYDRRKVGEGGPLGFQRSSDLARLISCLEVMRNGRLIIPGQTLFLDMGCADGRVNVLLSYLVRLSIGIEMHEWTLNDYPPMKKELEMVLGDERLPLPPDNIFLFHGDSSDETLYETIKRQIDADFGEIDLFYTYLTMYEEFAGLIARKAKKGAVFMVYGLGKILPRLEGLRLLTPDRPLEDILALYQKI